MAVAEVVSKLLPSYFLVIQSVCGLCTVLHLLQQTIVLARLVRDILSGLNDV